MPTRSKNTPVCKPFIMRRPDWDEDEYMRIWHEDELPIASERFANINFNRPYEKEAMYRSFWALKDGEPSDTAPLCLNAPAHFVSDPDLLWYDETTGEKRFRKTPAKGKRKAERNDEAGEEIRPAKRVKSGIETTEEAAAENKEYGEMGVVVAAPMHNYFDYTEYKSSVKYIFFRANILKILIGIMGLSAKPGSRIKASTRKFLAKWEAEKLTDFILSLIPLPVQSVLNFPDWTLEKLMYCKESWVTTVRGIYLLIAKPLSTALRAAGYVGAGTGMKGLYGRVPNHLSSTYRARENGKLLYKYVDGKIDGAKREILPFALAFFNDPVEGNCDKDDFAALHDIVELTLIIYLGLFDFDEKDELQVAEFAALRPASAHGKRSLIPTNRGNPISQIFGQGAAIAKNPRATGYLDDLESDRYETMGPTKKFEDAQTRSECLQVHQCNRVGNRESTGLALAFTCQLYLNLPWTLMKLFRVRRHQLLKVTWSLCPAGERHQKGWIQDTLPSDDPEASIACRLGMQVSGIDDMRPWSFWVVRDTNGCDWSHSRRTSNHLGCAYAMTIIEWVFQRHQQLPVPTTRVAMGKRDACLNSGINEFPSLAGTPEYYKSLKTRSHQTRNRYVLRNNQVVDIDAELKKVCVCDLLNLYKTCDALVHDRSPVESDSEPSGE